MKNKTTELVVDCACFHFKKRPEVCIRRNYEVIATIWQIGPGEFFFGKGKEKISRKSGTYLGTFSKEGGKMVMMVCDPSQRPSHTPRRIRVEHEDYAMLLSKAYLLYQEIVAMKMAAA